MENFLTFLRDYERLFQIAEFFSLFIFGIMVYKKTGNINFIKEVFEKMNYRRENYNVVKSTTEDGEDIYIRFSPGQDFSSLKQVYRLNRTSGLLELTDETIDLQEQLNSYKDTELNALFEKFLPGQVQDLVVAEQHNVQDKLDFMQEAFALSEEFKDKYGFDSNLSMQEVFALVNDKNNELKKIMEVKKDEAQKVIEDGKQEAFPKDGTQGQS